jgi:citrate synthase
LTVSENKGGLEGVVVAEITTSFINGEIGRLVYAGYEIEDLAANSTFEEVEFLLWHNRLPSQEEYEALRSQIASEAGLPAPIIAMMKALPRDMHPMAVLRTVVSALAGYDADAENLTDKEVARAKAARLTGQITTATAAWMRILEDKEIVAPREDLTLAQNFVWMTTGEGPDETKSKAVDVYLILLAEHGMNASTFASRVITATGSDMHSAVTGAIGALKGPSHGGANSEAMKMFFEIESAENVDKWFTEQVKGNGRRVMGIGHRVYKSHDPRAGILKAHSEALAKSTGNAQWYDLATKLEEVALADDYFKERKLYPNVDYYSAIMLYTLDIPIDLFTPLFVMSRIAGWSAHIIDQMSGRLIRPRAKYIGEMDLSWAPFGDR